MLDDGSLGKTDANGAPRIFSINDRDYLGIDYFERGDGWPIICRSGMRAQSGCDTLFEYAGTPWMLLLPNSQRDNAKALVEKAQQLLEGFLIKALRITFSRRRQVPIRRCLGPDHSEFPPPDRQDIDNL